MENKSWKREVGFLLLCFLMVLASVDKIAALTILAFPFVGFALGAFGLDSVLKQGEFSFSRNTDDEESKYESNSTYHDANR